MQTESCSNGHYYDSNKYNTCPYCDESKPTLYQRIDELNEETQVLSMSKKQEMNTEPIDSETTQMLQKTKTKVLELVGWIVITSEEGKFKAYTISYGMNRIGRSSSNDISIENGDVSISREKHASIIYDFENNLFFIQHHEGKYLTYLNGQMIYALTSLKAYDKIKIGRTEFVFVPLCGDDFRWNNDEN